MRVVFLDIDGVLNRTKGSLQISFQEDLLQVFKAFLKRANTKIVLSTFWRAFGDYISYVLSRHGIPAELFAGRTPGNGHMTATALDDSVYADRSEEILAWLRLHPEVTGFVILDDRPEAGKGILAPHFVHVCTATGLTEADCESALAALDLPTPPDLTSLEEK